MGKYSIFLYIHSRHYNQSNHFCLKTEIPNFDRHVTSKEIVYYSYISDFQDYSSAVLDCEILLMGKLAYPKVRFFINTKL